MEYTLGADWHCYKETELYERPWHSSLKKSQPGFKRKTDHIIRMRMRDSHGQNRGETLGATHRGQKIFCFWKIFVSFRVFLGFLHEKWLGSLCFQSWISWLPWAPQEKNHLLQNVFTEKVTNSLQEQIPPSHHCL